MNDGVQIFLKVILNAIKDQAVFLLINEPSNIKFLRWKEQLDIVVYPGHWRWPGITRILTVEDSIINSSKSRLQAAEPATSEVVTDQI